MFTCTCSWLGTCIAAELELEWIYLVGYPSTKHVHTCMYTCTCTCTMYLYAIIPHQLLARLYVQCRQHVSVVNAVNFTTSSFGCSTLAHIKFSVHVHVPFSASGCCASIMSCVREAHGSTNRIHAPLSRSRHYLGYTLSS